MKGDFTRFRAGNESRYSDVLQQQGRVGLDSDWNEAAAINSWQRRQRTIDAFGHFAAVGDAFRATYLPNLGDFAFEPGRAYLAGLLIHREVEPELEVSLRKTEDGLVLTTDRGDLVVGGVYRLRMADGLERVYVRIDGADNGEHRASVAADDSLDILPDTGRAMVERAVTYRTQDVEVAAPFADASEDTGAAHALVLDVWERHVTAVEDPGLLEEALGGPDTTTRLRTDWAIRLLDVAPDATCSTDPANLHRGGLKVPGRMSAWVVPSAEFEDPCLLPTDAGYRGLGNRLYRVEVHEGNARGTSLDGVVLKWSRNNGAAVAAVTENKGDTVVVTDLGADDEGLRAAPLVELFDLVCERTPAPGLLLEPIANVDPSNRKIQLPRDVTDADSRPWHADTLRVRRWDGIIADVEAGDEVELELGIHVSFTEGSYRPGDYWLVPARTATGRIQELDHSPPTGVTHHYAKVAVARLGGDGFTVTDCRPCLVPITGITAECSPLITVGDCGDVRTLPEAIDRIEGDPATFPEDVVATVKLLQGHHRLAAPVVVRRSNFRLTGCGAESRLVCSDSFSALAFGAEAGRSIHNVAVDDLAIHGAAPRGLVAARSVHGLELRRLTVTLDGSALEPEGAAAIATSTCRDVSIVGCYLEGQAAVVGLGEDGALLRFPQFGTVSVDGESVLIRGNRVHGAGVWVRHGALNVRIDDNEIDGGAASHWFPRSFAGVVLGGLDPSLPRDKKPEEIAPDDLALSGVEITRNRILRRTGTGVATLAADAVKVNYPGIDLAPIPIDPKVIPVGDLVAAEWCFDRLTVAKPFVLSHAAFSGWLRDDLAVPKAASLAAPLLWAIPHLPVRFFDVAGRRVSPLAEPRQLRVESNDIRGCADATSPDGRLSASVHGGVVLEGARDVGIERNFIVGNGVRGRAVGIWLDDALEVRIHANRIEDNGREDPPDKPPRLVDFADVVLGNVKADFAGIEVLSAPYAKANLSIAAIVSNPTTEPLPVVGAMPGQPLGALMEGEVEIAFTEESRSPSLGMSLLPAKKVDEPLTASVELADDSRVDVTIDPRADYRADFEQPIKSIRLTSAIPLILTRIWWGPVAVQAGMVVLGATGRRAFGKAGLQTLSIQGNTVRTPAGPALAAQMVGDGAVVENVLVSEAYAPQPRFLISRLGSSSKSATGACVAVEQRSSLIFPFLSARSVLGSVTTRNSRLLSSSLRFAGNQVRQSVSSHADISQSLPVIVSLRADDADFTHNVVEALLSRGDARTNVLIGSSTSRIVSNRMAEVACSTTLSLEVRASGQVTAVDNQADHQIEISRPDGTPLTVDPSNASELAACNRPGVAVASRSFAGLLAGAFAVVKPAEVPGPAASGFDAYLQVLASRRDASLEEWQSDAARKVVRSLSPVEIAKETLEVGGRVDPDLSAYLPQRDVVELGETYREITEVVTRVRPGVFTIPEMTGGLVRTVDGRAVEGARVVIESKEGVVAELDAGPGGRIEGEALTRALERAGTVEGAVRYRVEARNGELLDDGVIEHIQPGTAPFLDLTVRTP